MKTIKLNANSAEPSKLLDLTTNARPVAVSGQGLTLAVDLFDGVVATPSAGLLNATLEVKRPNSTQAGNTPLASDPALIRKVVTLFNAGSHQVIFSLTDAEMDLVDNSVFINIQTEDTGNSVKTYASGFIHLKRDASSGTALNSVPKLIAQQGAILVAEKGALSVIYEGADKNLREESLITSAHQIKNLDSPFNLIGWTYPDLRNHPGYETDGSNHVCRLSIDLKLWRPELGSLGECMLTGNVRVNPTASYHSQDAGGLLWWGVDSNRRDQGNDSFCKLGEVGDVTPDDDGQYSFFVTGSTSDGFVNFAIFWTDVIEQMIQAADPTAEWFRFDATIMSYQKV